MFVHVFPCSCTWDQKNTQVHFAKYITFFGKIILIKGTKTFRMIIDLALQSFGPTSLFKDTKLFSSQVISLGNFKIRFCF